MANNKKKTNETTQNTVTLTGGGPLPVTAYKVTGTENTSSGAVTQTPKIISEPKKVTTAQTAKAASDLEKWKTERPAEYKDSYSGKIDSLFSSLGKRKFSYDPEKDPSYVSFRNKYLSDAKSSMEDAAGKASAKTGGFSNSYAQTAGNLAYNKTMQDFAEVLPELYRAAYDRYSDEGDSIESRIKLLTTLSGNQWDRYNDTLKNYLTEGKMLEDFYSGLSENDMDNYLKYLSVINK